MEPPPADSYSPRDPEQSLLFQAIADQLEPFLREQRERDPDGPGIPAFVERELRRFLGCGKLERGFSLLKCDRCADVTAVPFSCKASCCPSCGARKMLTTAANLVDSVFPFAPTRQWVLSLPFPLNLRLARDAGLLSEVRKLFTRSVAAFLRLDARRRGIRDAQPGLVCMTQRFSSKLSCYVHFHLLALDGVYAEDADGHLQFHCLPKLADEDVARVLARIVRRARRLLQRRDDDELPPTALDVLRAPRPASGRTGTLFDEDERATHLCSRLDGFSLHAARHLHANDRPGLEALVRYTLRPPVSLDRLSRRPDGTLVLRLKKVGADGCGELELSPRELVRRLAAIVPPPRVHEFHYYGVFAPRHAWRRRIVPKRPKKPRRCSFCIVDESRQDPWQPRQLELPLSVRPPDLSSVLAPRDRLSDDVLPLIRAPFPRDAYLSHAELLKRTFAVDVFQCPCGGRRRLVSLVTDPDRALEILETFGLRPKRPRPRPPAAALC